MWRDILLQNNEVLLDLLEDWKKEMNYVYEMLTTADNEEIFQYFQSAKTFRDEMPQKQKEPFRPFMTYLSMSLIIQVSFRKLLAI